VREKKRQVPHFPTTYLGIPLSVAKLRKSALQPLLDKAADCLPAWKGRLLHRSGRLTLVRMTLSAIPIYTAISTELPPWLKAFRKIMTAFLWTGTEVVHGGKCLVAWDQVQRPLPLGGLGVLDLRLMGMALRLRWLWLQRTEPSRPWGTLPFKSDSLSQSFFMRLIKLTLGDGNAFLFWTDPWLEGRSITELAPDLLDAVTMRKCRKTVAEVLSDGAWIRDISGALTVPVLTQYLQCAHPRID
jgi:hypothetical protein